MFDEQKKVRRNRENSPAWLRRKIHRVYGYRMYVWVRSNCASSQFSSSPSLSSLSTGAQHTTHGGRRVTCGSVASKVINFLHHRRQQGEEKWLKKDSGGKSSSISAKLTQALACNVRVSDSCNTVVCKSWRRRVRSWADDDWLPAASPVRSFFWLWVIGFGVSDALVRTEEPSTFFSISFAFFFAPFFLSSSKLFFYHPQKATVGRLNSLHHRQRAEVKEEERREKSVIKSWWATTSALESAEEDENPINNFM